MVVVSSPHMAFKEDVAPKITMSPQQLQESEFVGSITSTLGRNDSFGVMLRLTLFTSLNQFKEKHDVTHGGLSFKQEETFS